MKKKTKAVAEAYDSEKEFDVLGSYTGNGSPVQDADDL